MIFVLSLVQRKGWRQKHQPHSPTARIWAPSVTSSLSLAGVPTSAIGLRRTSTAAGRLWWKRGISCNPTLIFEKFLSSQLTTMRVDMVIGNNFTKMVHITLLTWCHFFLFHFILAPRLAIWIKVLWEGWIRLQRFPDPGQLEMIWLDWHGLQRRTSAYFDFDRVAPLAVLGCPACQGWNLQWLW